MSMLDVFKRTKAGLTFLIVDAEKSKFEIELKKDDYTVGRATITERETFFKSNKDWVKIIGEKIAIRPAIGHNISREHVKLHWNGNTYQLTALNSIRVNGKKIDGTVALRSGDKLLLSDSIQVLYFV